MSLTPLLDALSADPVVRKVVETARRGDAPLVDVAVSPGARSPLLAALAGGGATPAAGGHRHRPRGRGPGRRPALLPAGRPGRRLPVLGDAAARAAQPPQRHRRPPARGAAPADPPGRERPGVRPARRRGRPDPRGAAAAGQGARRAGAGLPVGRRRAPAGGGRRGAGRGGVHPHRPGRAARRVRRARRHPRRLPADRGAPRPGRVLGRHGRGDPLVQGRRPAQPRGRRARPVGAAVPRDPADRRRSASAPASSPSSCPASPTCSARSPRASRSRAWSRSPRPWSTAWRAVLDVLRAGHPRRRSATPSGSAPAPTTSSPPAPSSSTPAGPTPPPATPSRSTCRGSWAARRTGGWPTSAGTRCTTGRPWWSLTSFAGDEELAAFTDGADDLGEHFTIDTTDVEPYRGDTPSAVADMRRLGPRRLAGRRRHRGPRPGPARRRGARRARRARPAGATACEVGLEPGIVARHDRLARARASSRPGAPRGRHRDRPDRHGRAGPVHQGHAPDAVAPAQRRSTRCSCAPGDFVVHEQHGVGRFVEMMQRTVGGATREYLVIEYAASQARPAGRPAVRADRPARPGHPLRRRRGPDAEQAGRLRLAEDQGPGQEARQGDRRRADPALQRPDGHARATPSARTPRGSASSRTPSPTSRRPTSWSASTRSRPTWSARSRWTGSSAATSATARPRSRSGRRSRRSRTASRSRSSCRRRCWSSSTCRPSPSATPSSRSWSRRCPGSRATPRPRRSSPG